MEFVFQISEYNQDDLKLQTSKALDKLTELTSRQRVPRLWKVVDRLDTVPKVSKPVLKCRAIRYKIYGVFLLVLGVFLLVPGLVDARELLVPLISGGVCVLLGLACLLPRRKKPSRKFHAAAKKLLSQLQTSVQLGVPITVHFTQDGMMLPEGEVISYNCFNSIVETESIYLLTWKDKVTILQKQDLLDGNHENFLRVLEEKAKLKSCYVH